jgi:hypothetical protein
MRKASVRIAVAILFLAPVASASSQSIADRLRDAARRAAQKKIDSAVTRSDHPGPQTSSSGHADGTFRLVAAVPRDVAKSETASALQGLQMTSGGCRIEGSSEMCDFLGTQHLEYSANGSPLYSRAKLIEEFGPANEGTAVSLRLLIVTWTNPNDSRDLAPSRVRGDFAQKSLATFQSGTQSLQLRVAALTGGSGSAAQAAQSGTPGIGGAGQIGTPAEDAARSSGCSLPAPRTVAASELPNVLASLNAGSADARREATITKGPYETSADFARRQDSVKKSARATAAGYSACNTRQLVLVDSRPFVQFDADKQRLTVQSRISHQDRASIDPVDRYASGGQTHFEVFLDNRFAFFAQASLPMARVDAQRLDIARPGALTTQTTVILVIDERGVVHVRTVALDGLVGQTKVWTWHE